MCKHLRRATVLATLAMTVFGVIAGTAAAKSPRSADQPTIDASTPCVGLSGAPSRIEHVIVLFMENQPYDEIVGNPEAPYYNELQERCGAASNYHNITHPSAPEYIAATSGKLGGEGDCPPVFLDPSWPPTCPDPNDNIFNQTMEAGETWKVYQESMATNCLEGEDETNYDINHNPAAYYTDLGGPAGEPNSPCDRFDVPMGTPQEGNFETDLADGTLANYSFVSPDLIHDTHNGTIAEGDEYLSELIPTIIESPEYKDGSTVLFLTWDEGEHGETDECAYNTTDRGCHIAMSVISSYVEPDMVSHKLYNHYSLLKTTEQLLGLPLLGHAADPKVKSMTSAFHL